jgi:ABC-type multidrug transport system ATPase subunit
LPRRCSATRSWSSSTSRPPASIPEERVRFHNLLADIASDVIVILSTHIVSDVADLCGQLAVIDAGKVLLTGEPDALVAAMRGRIWRKAVGKNEIETSSRASG